MILRRFLFLIASICFGASSYSQDSCTATPKTKSEISEFCFKSSAENFKNATTKFWAIDGSTGYEPIETERIYKVALSDVDTKSINDLADKRQIISAAFKKYVNDHEHEMDLGPDPILNSSKAKLVGLTCAIMDSECRRSLAPILSMMKSAVVHALPDVRTDVMTSDIFWQATAKLAVKLMKKAMLASNGIGPTGNLYEDAYNSFVECGAQKDVAKEGAFKLLALYAIRGTNYATLNEYRDYKSDKDESKAFRDSFMILQYSINFLDAETWRSGHPYSYPSQITTSCNYSRPYHFWLSAYLAHELRKKGIDGKVAVRAVHTAGLDYEYVGGTTHKRSMEAEGDFYRTETLKNIAFNDMGAFFGASDQNRSLDGNKLLSDMIERSSKKSGLAVIDFLQANIRPLINPWWYEALGGDAGIDNAQDALK